jgi:hypothetical protein
MLDDEQPYRKKRGRNGQRPSKPVRVIEAPEQDRHAHEKW